MDKTITISDEVWGRLTQEKLNHRLPNLDSVIKRLLNNEWSREDDK